MHPNPSTSTVKLVAAFAAIYVVWGSTYLAIRYAVEGLPPLLMMGVRHVVAGGVLYAWLRLRGEAAPVRREWLPAAIAGAILFLGGHGLLAWSEQRVSSGLAALLVASEPLVMVLLAWKSGQERLSSRIVIGLLLGMGGIAVLCQTGVEQGTALGVAAVLIAAILWSVGAIYSRGIRTNTSAGLFAAMQMITGGVLLLLVSAGSGERVAISSLSAKSVLSLAYLIVFGSVLAFTAYTWLMRVTTAARVSTHCYVNPIIAVLLGWAIGGEQITTRMLVGSIIVVLSVVLVVRRGTEPAPRAARIGQEVAAD